MAHFACLPLPGCLYRASPPSAAACCLRRTTAAWCFTRRYGGFVNVLDNRALRTAICLVSCCSTAPAFTAAAVRVTGCLPGLWRPCASTALPRLLSLPHTLPYAARRYAEPDTQCLMVVCTRVDRHVTVDNLALTAWVLLLDTCHAYTYAHAATTHAATIRVVVGRAYWLSTHTGTFSRASALYATGTVDGSVFRYACHGSCLPLRHCSCLPAVCAAIRHVPAIAQLYERSVLVCLAVRYCHACFC
jgi:hypothetical protein